jgi:glyoxylase-like metal-dependent hydrolase (beta-lactamase superfamily II)
MSQYFMCSTCGVQYAASDSEQPPDGCIICMDERQYIGINGQQWTTLEAIQPGRKNTFTPLIPGLTSIVTEPQVAIGQRAHLLQTPQIKLLWDCISMIDDATVEQIKALGGIDAIAISHPHYYSTIVEWSHAFGNVPIYIHSADRQWITRPDPVIKFWEGQTCSLADGITLINCGGHFDGSTVLHWRDGLDQKGVVLSGDTLLVVSDRRYVTFMYSYPNYIPLPPVAVNRILQMLEPYNFEQVYDAFGKIVIADGKAAVKRSAARYIQNIQRQ